LKEKGKTKSNKHLLDADFLSNIDNLCQVIQDIAKSTVPVYKEFAYNVINEHRTDIDQIEHQLDYMRCMVLKQNSTTGRSKRRVFGS